MRDDLHGTDGIRRAAAVRDVRESATSLDEPARKTVMYALRHPRGRYESPRASQLSGIPRSTIYDWRRHQVFVPDFDNEVPAAWSYRDLVYLRLLAWLRQGGMERGMAAEHVRSVKREVASGREIRFLYANKTLLVADEERTSRVGRQSLLPFDSLFELVSRFDLFEPVTELGGSVVGRLWAPDLVNPSQHTFISPWVMAGDPCVARTRIPTSSIHALREERGLLAAEITELYRGLTVEAAHDAYILERRLRGLEPPDAAAA